MSDAHYDKVSLLLPMSGSNNGTTFADFSPVPKAVTRVGDTKTVTAQSKYYGSSAYFDGSGDYLTVPHSADILLDGNFTIEFWIRLDGTPAPNTWPRIIAKAEDTAGGFIIFTSNSRGLAAKTNASVTANSGALIEVDEFTHCSVVRENNVVSVSCGGIFGPGVSMPGTIGGTNILFVGSSSSHQYRIKGWIQDLRITNGIARYSGNFTPPARLIGEISGTVDDDTDVGAVRRIVAFPRLAPSRVVTTQSASDGSYTLTGLPVTEHTVVYLDDDAGTLYNDLCHRVIPA